MKQSMISELKELYKSLPEQRSDEWRKMRKTVIGGSELAKLSSLSSRRSMIEDKLGIKTPFEGNLATRWGTVLETLSTLYLSTKFNVVITEFGSIPSSIAEFRYSPDGIAYFPEEDKIKIIEIKNPFSRIPDGKIPTQYKPQVYGGLDAVPLADSLIYCDFLVRRCPLEELASASLASDASPASEASLASDASPYIGFIYTRLETERVDYGACDMNMLDDILQSIISGTHHIKFAEYNMLDSVREELKDFNEAGILPLKLFKCHIVEIDRTTWKKEKKYANMREEKFTDTLHAHMVEVVKIIKELSPLPYDEQVDKLNAMFTKKCPVVAMLTPEELNAMLS